MSRTLRYGTNEPRLTSRIDRHVVRRRTPCGYDRVMQLAAQDFARHVAAEVSPGNKGAAPKPTIHFQPHAKPFGKR